MYNVKFEAIDKANNIGSSIQNVYTKAQVPVLTVNNTLSSSLDLNFTDNNPASTQYQIMSGTSYVNSTGALTLVPTWVTLNSKKISVNGLAPNTTYTFKAVAINANSVITAVSAPVSGTTLVAAPTGITGTSSANSVTLSWPAVAGAAKYYISNDGVT
jgi:hypothetical protein